MAQTTYTVFVSSTAEDLADFRDAVDKHLTGTKMFVCTHQKTMGGRHAETVESCIDHAARADFYVGLIGMRRGWEPDEDAQRRSITEIEYDSAKHDGRFVYMTNERFPVPGNLRETDDEHRRQLQFRNRVKTRIVAQADFTTPETLATQIVRELLVHVQTRERDTDPLANLPDAVAERIVKLLDERGDIKRAERGGLERDIVLKLAKRIKPDDTLDFERAVAELENAITIALDAIARGRRGSNEDEFVNQVLKSVGALTQAGENERAVKALDEALKELDVREAEQRESMKRSRLTLLEAGIEQDILRRDAPNVAGRAERIATIEHPDDQAARLAALRVRQNAFYVEGRDKGINFSLDVAIEIARRMLAAARGMDQRGATLNDLGIALRTLGERESSTTRLEEAVTAYREALKERTPEHTPVDRARTLNNLGSALGTLGERENGTVRLEEAVEAFREALRTSARTFAPLFWAIIQNNLGNALAILANRTSDIARLDDAIAAYQAALEEQTREHTPLDWAMTQNNLGNALGMLGTAETETTRLEKAIAAYSEALKEFTREHLPLRWAMSCANQAAALTQLAERRGDLGMVETAVSHLEDALVVMREIGHLPFAQYCETWLSEARAIRDRLNKA